MVFPVALMEKHCEHVDASEIEASFANPHSLVLISFLAPVVLAIYELLVHKLGELRDKANELFGVNLAEPEEEAKPATYEEYRLKQATKKTRRESEMAQSIGFTLIHLGLALAVAADYYQKINSVVIGQSIMCRASKVLVMPLFSAFAISMWNVLMTVTNYVHWEHSRRETPKDVEIMARFHHLSVRCIAMSW
jgi:membrane glycosyltransferase